MSIVTPRFNMPQQGKVKATEPRFSANQSTSRPLQAFDRVEEGNTHTQKQSGPAKRAVKAFVSLLALTSGAGLLTSPFWAPITGVGTACRTHEPDGAIAKVFPIAGLGPAKALCPSAFVMENGDIYTNDAPSWDTFHKKGHASANGVVSHQDGIVGRLVGDNFYKGRLSNDILISQTHANNPQDFDTLAPKAAASKEVDDKGTVRQVGKWGVIKLTEGKTELVGEAKGKKLEDLPEDQQVKIKAAAAANSYLWAKS